MNQQPENFFQVRELTKVYHMGEVEVHALRGVNMELYAGELVVLLGPSGSGKSTLLNIMGGLDTATGGFVSYRGKELTVEDMVSIPFSSGWALQLECQRGPPDTINC